MQLKILLKGNQSNQRWPTVDIRINSDSYYNGEIRESHELVFDFLPIDNNVLEIEHYGKSNNDTVVDSSGKIVSDLSVELSSMFIDDTQILETVLYDTPFYVKWPKNLIDDFVNRGEKPPEYLKNNLYFGFNGTYYFQFSNNISQEYYKQFWIDEVQAHYNQTEQQDQDEVFDRMGEKVSIVENNNFTIHDLERVVLKDES